MPGFLNFEKAEDSAKKVLEITSFAGIDLSSAKADIERKRSPDAPNMMPDSKGNPIKRTGFFLLKNYGGRINGAFVFGEKLVVHAGEKLFADGELIFEGLADKISSGQTVGNKFYLFDGKAALVYDGEAVFPLCEKAYIPTVLISKNADECERKTVLKGNGMSTRFILPGKPAEITLVSVNGNPAEYSLEEETVVFSSPPAENAEIIIEARLENEPGGTLKEEINLISDRWKESFLCDTGTEKSFTLSQKNLSEGAVKALVLDENGSWQEKTEGTDFSVDRENGKIVFSEPVSKTPVSGEDNLVIEAEKVFEGYKDKINKCCRSICFDNGGTSGRIFVCGNPEKPESDFWCAAGDPTYWPDIYYSELCGKGSEILGYSVIENSLATYISRPKDGRSIVIRLPFIDESGNVSFPIEKHLQGEPAVSPNGFVFMESEQLFLTERCVYAITTEDISGEKYTQNRSYFINRALCKEDLKNAFCTKWKQFYVIAAGGKLYLLDSSQRDYRRGEPLSGFQYECYLWTGVPARILWEMEGKLFFGDEEGNVCFFSEEKDFAGSYGDFSPEGKKAICAYWTFPDFSGETFWRNKTIKTAALELAPYAQNKVRLEFKINGIWKVIKEWTGKISYFGWNAVSWPNFTWSGNSEPRTVAAKTKIKKFDKAGFRVVCDEMDKAFGLYGFSLEYVEKGRIK